MATLDLSQFTFPEVMNIRLASVYLDMSEMRVRTLLREGRIQAEKDEAGVWAISKAALDTFKAEKASGPRRTSGGTKGAGKAWVIRVPAAKFEAVKSALGELGIELEQRYNYEKMRAYQAARKARLAAEGKSANGKAKKAAKVTATPAQ